MGLDYFAIFYVLSFIFLFMVPEFAERLRFFVQEQYWAPPDFKRLLSAKLKFLTASGKLIKVNLNFSKCVTC